jgi:FkbM family methyltransferase
MKFAADETPKPWGEYAPSPLLGLLLKFLHALPSGRGWRRLALWLRKPLKNSIDEWIDLVVWNLKLRLRAKGNLSEQRMIFMPQYLDQLERMEIASDLANGGVFFDIGANAGAYSLWAASSGGPGTRIESFEPDPDLCASLTFNKQENSLSSITVHPLALGRHEGQMSLVRGTTNRGENHVRAAGQTDAMPVKMTTLPKFISEHGIEKINSLKIDIEGYECDALEPLFLETPRSKWPNLLICEVVHDQDSGLAALLKKNGYRLTGCGRLNGIYRLDP